MFYLTAVNRQLLNFLHSCRQKAVESIIIGHLLLPLPREIIVEGQGYVLHGCESITRVVLGLV